MSLYRDAAIKAQASNASFYGNVNASIPLGWYVISACIFIFVVVATAILALTDFSRRETANGILRYNHGETRLIAAQPGVIGSCLVRENQYVETGDVLFNVNTSVFYGPGQTLTNEQLSTLDDEIASVNELKSELPKRAGIQIDIQLQNISSAETFIASETRALTLLKNELALASARLQEAQVDFAQGLITKDDEYSKHESVAEFRQSIIAREAAIEAQRTVILESELAIQEINSATTEQLARLEQESAGLRSQQLQLQAAAGYVMKASTPGYVADHGCRAGETVMLGQHIMTILPENSELIAELRLPTSTIALVSPGQTVKIKYDALPYQRFGVFEGEIDRISASPSNTISIGNRLADQEPSYLAEVSIYEQNIEYLGETVDLQSGMSLSADIILEDRTVLRLLTDPILRR